MDEMSEAVPPGPGHIRGHRDRFIANGMEESQGARVQGDAVFERVDGAVAGIADDGVAEVGELDAQLMRASRLRSQLEPAQILVACLDLEVQ